MTDAREFAEHPIPYWEKHHLLRGHKYRVWSSFFDADGIQHPVGEKWMFVGSGFSKFEDEYTLCVCFETGKVGLIRLRDESEQQQEVVAHLKQYLTQI